MRDVTSPSGLPGDDQSDAWGSVGGRAPGRSGSTPRHLAADPEADDDPADEPTRPSLPRSGRIGRTVLEWAAVVACGVLVAYAAQTFLVQAFWIPSPSMTPTLEVDDRVLVNKLSYRTHDVRRGDVVVFERPPAASSGGDGEIKDLIKRVVAVGGDTLEGRDGQVYVNDERIDEPYLVDATATDNLPRQVIPDGFVFVMGDNRSNSEDSRVFGPIDEDTIVGRAFVKVLPVSDLGWL